MLIAGAGPAGLTLAINLGQLGVRCEVLDARPAPARVPRAGRCGSRAMEIFRQLGFSGRLRAAGLPGEASLDVVDCAGSLARQLQRHRHPSPRLRQPQNRPTFCISSKSSGRFARSCRFMRNGSFGSRKSRR